MQAEIGDETGVQQAGAVQAATTDTLRDKSSKMALSSLHTGSGKKGGACSGRVANGLN